MAAPWMIALLVAHAAGEVVGGVGGPGNEPSAAALTEWRVARRAVDV